MLAKISRHLTRILITLLLGGLFAATLVRFAPGFDTDEQQTDLRLSAESVQALRSARAREHNIARFYAGFLSSALRGDFGQSRTLNRPVRELVGERLPVTMKLIAFGLLVGWSLGFVLAVTAVMSRLFAYDVLATLLAGLFLCIPSAVLALLFVYANAPG